MLFFLKRQKNLKNLLTKMSNSKKNSIYKTIGEVAKILKLFNKRNGSLSTHTLRFWEKEFKQIRPKIFSGNRRYYDENSIIILKKIKYLLKDKGMTLNGVKKVLNSENSDIDELYNTSINQKNIIKSKLKKIKKLITDIKN
jgi:DNA-binding transcriptional MerR regulator